jgi:hypothetical protein
MGSVTDPSVRDAILRAAETKDVTAILTHGMSPFVAHLVSRPTIDSVVEAVVDANQLEGASTFTTFHERENYPPS